MDIIEQLEIKKQFGKFLIGFILKGHTTTDEALEEIEELTDKYLQTVPDHLYFDDDMVRDYIDFMKQNISEENIGFPHLYFQTRRYIDLLQNYVKHYIKKYIQLKK